MRWIPFFLFMAVYTGFVMGVVPTEGIQAVRERTESASAPLNDTDKAAINKFLLSALNDIFLSDKSEETAKTRRQILEQKGTKDLSMYATAYITLLREQLSTTAYSAIKRIEDPARQLMVRRNLMILVAELRSLLLIQFGLERAEDPDSVIRYWAVKSLTNPSIAQQLNSEVTTNPEAAAQIDEKLKLVVQNEKQPEILAMVAGFGAAWQDERAAALLKQLADRRIEAYKNCTIRYPWLDGRALNALADKYEQQKLPDEKAGTARSFGRLLAVIMQRWMQDQAQPEGQKTLSEETSSQMVSVMVEAEDQALPKLEVSTGGSIRRALERGGSLQQPYEELLGSAARSGALPSKAGFDYGRDADGRTLTAPPALPPCPAAGTPSAGG